MTLPGVVREPKQARSREAWDRVLDVATELFEAGGLDALSITEVCRRCTISPPSLYARVDGKAGLFAAIYNRGMAKVNATEQRMFSGLPRPGADLDAQAADAAAAIAEVFATHASFLRPVIALAGGDSTLLQRGATESRRLLERAAAAIDVPRSVSDEIARTLYAECVLRTMYGADFFTGLPESEVEFRNRLARTASAQAAQADRIRSSALATGSRPIGEP